MSPRRKPVCWQANWMHDCRLLDGHDGPHQCGKCSENWVSPQPHGSTTTGEKR